MNPFEEANKTLDEFIENSLTEYHHLRNYDFGIENRSNVSQISKYTSHRILNEYEIIEKLNDIDKRKKFTEEILWRIYWKGYLENHKSIWIKYKNFKDDSYDSNIFKAAKDGNTGIYCFDTWIEELRENNYLHNHTRIWFASIWIFTLRLPWQLGARLFMRHLLDGDASSNTLSWRWVAGMHTNKKPYIASKENINKYTVNRFTNTCFNLSKKINTIKYSQDRLNTLPIRGIVSKSKILIMFDNDLNISNRSKLFDSYSKVYILSNGAKKNQFGISEKVSNFKQDLIENISKLIPNSVILKSSDLEIFLTGFSCIDVIYPGIGNNLDLISECVNKKQVIINYIYLDKDLVYWEYAKSGFYKFKKSFYSINY